jgi:nucleotide-binding universal stress UspA family protein
MSVYQRILVAVDGSKTSDHALQEAIRLAKDQGASLRIVHVIDTAPLGWDMDPTQIQEIREILRQVGQNTIEHARATTRSSDIAAEARLVEIDIPGMRIASRIAEAAGAWPADLLVIGTHGRRGIDHLLLGSVAEGVVRVAPVPVLLIRGK